MSRYVIGDLQGCFETLQALLAKIGLDRARDQLWFVGDLVNRGPGSLECLRFAKSLGASAQVVLGNHDLHLLAVAEGLAKAGKLDTIQPILTAPDAAALLDWLRCRPLLHIEGRFAMVHAGLMPQWSWQHSQALAREVETALRGRNYRKTLAAMYGDEPTSWRDSLRGDARRRFVINTLTRMRALDGQGAHQLKYKAGLDEMPAGLRAWFDVPTVRSANRILYTGHWSAIGYVERDKVRALDTGCIWGGALTAVRLEDQRRFTQPCVETILRTNPAELKGE
jgi:bis(5'-nucleosyl)-tetraphosphatase (symmetrical)